MPVISKMTPPPSRDPDALPDSTYPHGLCPRCRRQSNFSVVSSQPITYDYGSRVLYGGKQVPMTVEKLSVLQCMGCQQNLLVVEELCLNGVSRRQGGSTGHESWLGMHWWPTPGMSAEDPDVPPDVADVVAEAHRCLAVQAPRAAVTMLRGALALVVEDKGSQAAKSKPNLYQQLQQMVSDGDLPTSLSDYADYLRNLGNAGAHPSTLAPVSIGEARELSEYMTHVLTYLYVMPARVQRSKANRS